MKPLPKAFAIACAIEGTLAASFASAGFGPCGLDNPLGFLGLLGHLPAVLIAWPVLSLVRIPEWLTAAVLVSLQIPLLTWLAWRFVRPERPRNEVNGAA
jgi:hypothetical protein